ncbi:MAG: glycosyltransferase, partial [Epsilonproteobacteria bacterium]|nr:glycosyltransferase [Campylobacterota bacterium]
GVKFVCLQKRGRYDLGFFWRYRRFLQKLQPDLIYSWLGEMNLFSLWCKPKLTKLIWSFRASNMDLSHYGRFSQLLFWLQKRGSFHVDRIVTNSWDSIEYHRAQGFDMDKGVVIPNGIDTTRFAPDPLARQEFRSHYALTDGEIAIGIVARYDPAKGYPILAQAAKMILSQYDRVHFFVVGYGDERIKRECEEILGSQERFIWLGKRGDVERIYPAFDIYLSSSLSESFSNTIAEAMACGVPCVVTDVGDSARIVGESGIVVEPGSVEALVRGIEMMMKSDRERLGQLARKRVVEHFSIARMVQRTQEVIEQCVES